MTTQLPPNDPNADDKLPGEDKLSAMYRQLPKSEPGPALDAAVLAAAAEALGSDQPKPATTVERRKSEREGGDWVHPKTGTSPTRTPVAAVHRKSAPRWLIGMSSAATLALAVGLAWHMRELPEANPKPAASIDDGRGASQAAAAMRSSESEDVAQAPTRQSDKQTDQPPLAEPQGVTASPVLSETRSRDSAAAYARNEAAAKQQKSALETTQATQRVVLQKRAASTPQQAASANGALMAPAPPAVMEVAVPAAAPLSESSTSVQAGDTPQQELAKIQLLVQQQHEVAARQRLQAFVHAHPQWELPPDLRDLLKQP